MRTEAPQPDEEIGSGKRRESEKAPTLDDVNPKY